MWRQSTLGVLIIIGAKALPPTLAAQVPAALFGTWELNSRESIQSSTRFKRTTCWIAPWEDGLRVTYDLVGERGGTIHLEWTGRFDGKDYSVQGADYVLTNAYTRIDDDAYDVVIKVDGVQVAKARTTISPDGQTLTTLTTERNAAGQEVLTTVVYDKH